MEEMSYLIVVIIETGKDMCMLGQCLIRNNLKKKDLKIMKYKI